MLLPLSDPVPGRRGTSPAWTSATTYRAIAARRLPCPQVRFAWVWVASVVVMLTSGLDRVAAETPKAAAVHPTMAPVTAPAASMGNATSGRSAGSETVSARAAAGAPAGPRAVGAGAATGFVAGSETVSAGAATGFVAGPAIAPAFGGAPAAADSTTSSGPGATSGFAAGPPVGRFTRVAGRPHGSLGRPVAAASLAVGCGLGAWLLRDQADQAYARYLAAAGPDRQRRELARARARDRAAGAALLGMEAGLMFTTYWLFY